MRPPAASRRRRSRAAAGAAGGGIGRARAPARATGAARRPGADSDRPGLGTSLEWYLLREGFPSAWNITNGAHAVVGVIDTGIDATHPDSPRSWRAAARPAGCSDATGPAGTDQVGHGTHVASLACAGTGNGIGMAGAGDDCKLVIEKTDFSDSSIAAAIVDAPTITSTRST